MAVNIRPLADRVLVKPLEAGEVKKGGIIIPDAHKEKPQEGKVVALGTGKRDDDGKLIEFTVKQGDTVRFVARNKGKVLHEMVLGTMDELKEHAELMRKHPGMEHDEPYMAHVAPGKTERIVWQFTKAGEFYYGCLVPGHFEAGMIGKIVVSAAK